MLQSYIVKRVAKFSGSKTFLGHENEQDGKELTDIFLGLNSILDVC